MSGSQPHARCSASSAFMPMPTANGSSARRRLRLLRTTRPRLSRATNGVHPQLPPHPSVPAICRQRFTTKPPIKAKKSTKKSPNLWVRVSSPSQTRRSSPLLPSRTRIRQLRLRSTCRWQASSRSRCRTPLALIKKTDRSRRHGAWHRPQPPDRDHFLAHGHEECLSCCVCARLVVQHASPVVSASSSSLTPDRYWPVGRIRATPERPQYSRTPSPPAPRSVCSLSSPRT